MFCRTFIFAFLAVGALAGKFDLPDRVKTAMKTKLTTVCTEAGGGAAHNAELFVDAVQSFIDCFNLNIDTYLLSEKINGAKVNGSLNEFVQKYCDKTPELKTCFHKLTDGVDPCVQEGAKDQLNLFKNSTDQLIDYVCYKDGERIAQFLTENGIECLQSKYREINACTNTTTQSQIDTFDIALSWTVAEKCGKVDDISTCMFKPLETCSTPTPGSMLQSLYRYVREGTACNDVLPLSPPAPPK